MPSDRPVTAAAAAAAIRAPFASFRAVRAVAVSVALPLLTLLILALPGCGPDEGDSSGDRAPDSDATVSVIDPSGRTVSLERPARRVVSMTPAVTEWIVALGAADRLVARTDYDDDPALDTLPSVGGGLTPSIEWLAARSPDLVIAWPDAPSRSVVSRLEQVGIPVYAAAVESIEDAMTVAADLGTLLGEPARAERAMSEVRRGLDSVRSVVAGRPRPDVVYLIGLDPLMAAGPGTFVDELLTAAGGRNVLHDLEIRWPQLSLEEVIRRAPEIVIIGSVRGAEPAALLASRPGWRQVPAVRTGSVHAVDPDRFNRPGPGLDEAAARLAEMLQGSGEG